MKFSFNDKTVRTFEIDSVNSTDNYIASENTLFITGNVDGISLKHYLILLEKDSPKLGIVLRVGRDVLDPNILLIPESNTIAIGSEAKVFFLDTINNSVKYEYKNDSVFYEFSYNQKNNIVLAIFETDVMCFGSEGHHLWSFNAKDIITNWNVTEHILTIETMEGDFYSLVINTGMIA